ncbi:MAG TPA: tetratricopeptide repeat protein [Pyrinomonadaceae bacterium]|jgi:tetratricopeptide (TPR) repeat protein
MIWQNTKIFLRLYYRPLAAMSSIIDEGSWLYGAVLVAAISMLLQLSLTTRIYQTYEAVIVPAQQQQEVERQRPHAPAQAGSTAVLQAEADEYEFNDEEEMMTVVRRPLPLVGDAGWWLVSFQPYNLFYVMLGLALLYVPATILVMLFFEPLGSFSVVLRRDYATMLACTLMAWAASHLPFALAGLALDRLHLGAGSALLLWSLSALSFGLLMTFALRTLFGAPFVKALSTVSVSWLALLVQVHVFSMASPLLFSPFILYYAYSYFRGDIGDIGFSYRQRRNFRRHLEQATVNPRDAEAHYQLGLVYQHRRQMAEAVKRFTRAIEIDPQERDARFQLGRIAREQGRLQEALDHFSIVIAQDDRHAHHEIWREIGATYVAAAMYAEAREALERYVERRPFDPEGLYYLGRSLKELGHAGESQEMFRRCIEAVKTMPYYRRSQLSKWRKLAQTQLSSLPTNNNASLATS